MSCLAKSSYLVELLEDVHQLLEVVLVLCTPAHVAQHQELVHVHILFRSIVRAV